MLKPSFAQLLASSPALSRRASCRTRAGDKRTPWLLSVLAIIGLAPANALAQHVHGVIELGIVVDGDTVAVSLNAPLSDVVGFEHAPQNDEQAELVQRAAALLSNPDAMFGLAGAANCSSSGMSVDGPEYLAQGMDTEHAGASSHDDGHDHEDHSDHSDHHDHEDSGDHDHGDGHDHDDHSDHHDEEHSGDHDHGGEHDHEDHHDHDHGDEHDHEDHNDHGHGDEHDHEDHHDHDHGDEHDHSDHDDHEEQHAEVNASYEWTCSAVSNLDALELRFIDGFVGVEEIEVQILTSSGARVLTAGRDTGSVSLATD